MKIAMIIDAWNPIVGWWQVHVKHICEKLILHHDCEIDLFVRALQDEAGDIYNQNEILFDGKLRIIRCGKSQDFFYFPERVRSIFSLFLRVIQENKIQKYDIIHAHSFLALFSWKLASIYLSLPYIWTVHGANLLDTWKKGLYYFVEKFLVTVVQYDTLITVGNSFLKHKNRNKNIVVIPNGVNIEDFENISSEKSKDAFKILFVWRYEWTKGIDILIEAIHLLGVDFLEKMKIEVHLIGYGYQEIEYKKLVKKYQLEKFIIFRGKIQGKELITEYASSHLFILPSRSEWFGMTIIEAMAAKVPVIATRCGGPEDIIEHWINGFLIEKENPQALKKQIEAFLFLGREQIEILKRNAYMKVIQKFTWDTVTEKIYWEYKKIRWSL